jgi:hypothetical protein
VAIELHKAQLDMPSTRRPLFYGITDARHAADERFWVRAA